MKRDARDVASHHLAYHLPDRVAEPTEQLAVVEEEGERFSYVLRRPGRHFQVDFDLRSPVDPPPALWGHEAGAAE